MHLLAYWRLDNYLRDLDEGAGFNFNSRQPRLHQEIEPGESLWLFTGLKSPPRYAVVARLVIRAKTTNPPGYRYGDYRVWGDLRGSRYFKLRPGNPGDDAFDVLRGLPLVSGSFAGCTRTTLPQACQTIRGITGDANRVLEQFTRDLPLEERATQVADEYELERELIDGGEGYRAILQRDHTGPSDSRRQRLLALAQRDRQLVRQIHDLYSGRCQLCGFDSPLVYGVPSAEAHHVVYLSRGGDDVLDNMVLLCPNHHKVIHRTDATFDYRRLTFLFPNGRAEPLCLNQHLRSWVDIASTASGPERDCLSDSALAELMGLIRSNLTRDLLTAEWAEMRRDGDHPLTGFCYVASEALYHLAGGATAGLSVYRCTFAPGKTHWWLKDADGRILDPTAEQFPGLPPYALGVRTHFLSRQPSHRAAALIAKVRAQHQGP